MYGVVLSIHGVPEFLYKTTTRTQATKVGTNLILSYGYANKGDSPLSIYEALKNDPYWVSDCGAIRIAIMLLRDPRKFSELLAEIRDSNTEDINHER